MEKPQNLLERTHPVPYPVSVYGRPDCQVIQIHNHVPLAVPSANRLASDRLKYPGGILVFPLEINPASIAGSNRRHLVRIIQTALFAGRKSFAVKFKGGSSLKICELNPRYKFFSAAFARTFDAA